MIMFGVSGRELRYFFFVFWSFLWTAYSLIFCEFLSNKLRVHSSLVKFLMCGVHEVEFIFCCASATKTLIEVSMHWRMNCPILVMQLLQRHELKLLLKIKNYSDQQWWSCRFSFSEWRDSTEAWAASDCKDHWVCWCCSGNTQVTSISYF